MSDSLQPHGLQHSSFPIPHHLPVLSQTSCSLSRWCHPTISSFVVSLLLLPSVFPSVRVFSNELALHIRWPKNWSFSFSINPSNEYRFPLELSSLTLLSKGLSRVFSSTTVRKHQFFGDQPSMVHFSHSYMTTGKITALTRHTSLAKWCLCFLIHCLGLS